MIRLFCSRAIFALVLAMFCASSLRAQSVGSIAGVARSNDDGSALSFAIVRLVPVDSVNNHPRQTLTDPNGRFRFDAVPVGKVRLQLELIGYKRSLSDVLTVRSAEVTSTELRSGLEPILVEGITVQAPGNCLTADALADNPQVATVWQEAQKGLAARYAFDLRYRYQRVLRQEGRIKRRILRDQRLLRVDTTNNVPDSVRARFERLVAAHRATGYAARRPGSFLLSVPNEKELLDDQFLKQHCLEARATETGGMYALRFRPIAPRRGIVDLSGTIIIDARSFLIHQLDFNYLDGDKVQAEATLDYGDVMVDGASFRLPIGGHVRGWPRGVTGAVIAEVTANLTFTYARFSPANAGP